MPWSRRNDGRIAQRNFGGYTFPRATYAQDKVGFYEMQTLYDTSLRFDNIRFYNEWFCTSILTDDEGCFRGVTAIEMKTGNFFKLLAPAGHNMHRWSWQVIQFFNICLFCYTRWFGYGLPCRNSP